MIKLITLAVVVVGILGGCGTTYTFEGQKYDSKEKFQSAVDSAASGALATIAPLATPLSQKKLVFAIPSESALVNENVRRQVAIAGSQPNAIQQELIDNLSRSNFKLTKIFFEGVQRKNIYKSVQFIEMQSMTGSFAPSQDVDTLYYVEPSQGSGQWFYASSKGGKQIFAFDRSSVTPAGKIQAVVDAVQAQAIRD